MPIENPPSVEIREEDILYRRLSPNHINKATQEVVSNAYKLNGEPDREISVDLAKLTTPAKSLACVKDRPGFRIGALLVKDVQSLGLTVQYAPLPDNPAHCVIKGNTTRQTCKLLAEKTKLI